MIDFDKMIEEMAEAIRCVNLYGEHDPHETIEGSGIIAKAALKAMCRALPSGRYYYISEMSMNSDGVIDRLKREMEDTRAVLYSKLLQHGKK